jgi:hypothetical protein
MGYGCAIVIYLYTCIAASYYEADLSIDLQLAMQFYDGGLRGERVQK